LFFTYYQFGDSVIVDQKGELTTKQNIFMYFAIVFVAFNVLLRILKSQVNKLPFSKMALPNKAMWTDSLDSREALLKVFHTWIDSFSVVINLTLSYILFVLMMINTMKTGSFSTYQPVLIICLVFAAFWWLVLLIRLSTKKLYL